jgi:hypothetical protein
VHSNRRRSSRVTAVLDECLGGAGRDGPIPENSPGAGVEVRPRGKRARRSHRRKAGDGTSTSRDLNRSSSLDSRHDPPEVLLKLTHGDRRLAQVRHFVGQRVPRQINLGRTHERRQMTGRVRVWQRNGRPIWRRHGTPATAHRHFCRSTDNMRTCTTGQTGINERLDRVFFMATDGKLRRKACPDLSSAIIENLPEVNFLPAFAAMVRK